MTLEFPNKSSNFDATRKTVRFKGHDGMFEVSFAIDVDALFKKAIGQPMEHECLTAFDTSRLKIQAAATKMYQRTRRSGYAMTACDLK